MNDLKFQESMVIIFWSLDRNFVMWYEPNKKVMQHFVAFPYTPARRGNQRGGCGHDDLQNFLDMT